MHSSTLIVGSCNISGVTFDASATTTENRCQDTPRAHYGPCKVFVAYKCKPARKQVSLQTGCRKKGLLFVSAYKHLATITYEHLATPHRRGRFYQILLGLPKTNGIGAKPVDLPGLEPTTLTIRSQSLTTTPNDVGSEHF